MAEEAIPSEIEQDTPLVPAEEEDGTSYLQADDGPPGDSSLDLSEDSQTEESLEEQVTPDEEPVAPFWEFKTASGDAKTFKSPEVAQQFFSSWNGRLSKAEKELEEAQQANYRWQEAYEAGNLSKSEKAEDTTPPEATSSGTEEAPVEPSAKSDQDLLSALDWKYVNELLESGDGVKAMQYMAYENGKYLKSEVDKLRTESQKGLEEITGPQEFQRQAAEAMQYAAESAYNAVDDMGQPLFPEFQDSLEGYDSNFVAHFRDIWLDQDINEAADPNLKGVKAAYYEAKATYRPGEANAAEATEAAPNASEVAAEVRDAQGRFMKQNTALAMSGSEPGRRPTPASGVRTNSDEEFMREMREANRPTHSFFSVSPD